MSESRSPRSRPVPRATRVRPASSIVVPGADALERELDRYVVELAALHGWLTYHVVRPEYGPPGFPDRVLARNDVVAVVELKRSAGPQGGTIHEHVDVSDRQRAWLDAIDRARWLASAVWRPGDVIGIRNFLEDPAGEIPGLWRNVSHATQAPAAEGGRGLRRVNR